jgi:glycerophosphoryl diester phosphodiesterase
MGLALGCDAPEHRATGDFDLQGHRGARGLRPENTLPAFAEALCLGVTTLELDLAVTRDGVVVVNHGRRVRADLTRAGNGAWMPYGGLLVNRIDFATLRRYDVGRPRPGSRYAMAYPELVAVDGTRVPSLAEVIELLREAGGDTRLNVEIKINPERPQETLPPDRFTDAAIDVLRTGGVLDRSSVQSFDWRALERARQTAPELVRVHLTDQTERDTVQVGQPDGSPWLAGLDVDAYGGSVPALVEAAGGQVWSPNFSDLGASELERAQALGLKVVVWTVNEPDDIDRMLELGVDGIISDYPNRVRDALRAAGRPLPPPVPRRPRAAAGAPSYCHSIPSAREQLDRNGTSPPD